MLKVGDPAPDFDLPDAGMEMVRLAAFRGKQNVVLYFYPKDDTPGCTMQAIDFSDLESEFTRCNAIVLGVSRDDCISHAAFRDKHGLTVQLLSDTDGDVGGQYGVMQEREKDGVKQLSLARSTFIIDKQGIVRHVFREANPRGHADEVLKCLKEVL
jgi:thioredoxin-dependent peroxiredoxin